MRLINLFFFLNILLCTNAYCNKIMKINIEGNERIDDATIISYLNLEKDNNTDISDLNIMFKELFSTELFYSKKLINSSELFSSDKFYLLNIWSSWCVPCRQEHPLLMSLSKSKKVDVIGINYKDTQNNAKSFLNKLGNPYKKIIFDKEGIHAIEWGAYGVPESFLIHNGMIVRKYIGPLNDKLIKEINLLVE